MSNATTIFKNELQRIEKHIIRLEEMMVKIMDELHEFKSTRSEEEEARLYKENYVYEEGEPEYGTDAWWEWSDKRAMEDIQAGRTVRIASKKELKEFFDKL